MTFAARYFDGAVPVRGSLADQDQAQLELISGLPDKVAGLIEEYRFKEGLLEVMAAARDSNKYFDYREPWVLRRSDTQACGTVINICLNTIKALSIVMEPFLPFAAGKVFEMLGMEAEERAWADAANPLPEGRPLGKPVILFSKLDVPESSETDP
jgi:methionyl-tRNA synthetase